MTSCPQTVRNGPLSMPRMWVAGLVAPKSLSEECGALQRWSATAGFYVDFSQAAAVLRTCCLFFCFIFLQRDHTAILVICAYVQHVRREMELLESVCVGGGGLWRGVVNPKHTQSTSTC